MRYIDTDKMIAFLEKEKAEHIIGGDYSDGVLDTCDNILAFINSFQQEQLEVDLENYIYNRLRELGADLINHKPYSFNRGLNVGKTNAYHDILDRLNARKEE